MAAKEGNKEILMKLLDKEVDVQIKDNNGKTAMDICDSNECMVLLKKY